MPAAEPVHQLKETKAGTVVTKCGITGKGTVVRTTAWFSETTCPQCLP